MTMSDNTQMAFIYALSDAVKSSSVGDRIMLFIESVWVTMRVIIRTFLLAVDIMRHLFPAAAAHCHSAAGRIPQTPAPQRLFQFRILQEQPSRGISLHDFHHIGNSKLRFAVQK